MKKKVVKKAAPKVDPKGTIELVDPDDVTLIDDSTIVNPNEEHIVTQYVFKNKYGIPIYAMIIKDCNVNLMNTLIGEYRHALDIKELMSVSVGGFSQWLADKGYEIDTNTETISWV